MLSMLCIAAVPIEAKTPKSPFAITISVENPASQTGANNYSVNTGSEVFVKVHLTNTSKHSLSVGYEGDSRTGVAFSNQYEVHDSTGRLIQKRTINHPEIGSTGHGWPGRILMPGESMDITGDHISRLYDLSQLDAYTIQLSRSASSNPEDGIVKSNTITVTVTKQ
jgi:hypothetical protein